MKKNNKMIYYLYCVGINTYDAAGNKLRAEYWTIPTFNPGGPIGPGPMAEGPDMEHGLYGQEAPGPEDMAENH